MIDKMIALLDKEQTVDDEKKAFCVKELDLADDKGKELARDEKGLDSKIEEEKSAIEQLLDDIANLVAGIKDLDKEVADAADMRRQENKEFRSERATNAAAKKLLNLAKKRMSEFYNKSPALVQEAPVFVQLLSEGSLAASKIVPLMPKETFGAYTKKGSESTGVIELLDTIIGDIDKEMAAAEAEETIEQKTYKQTMQETRDRRALLAKELESKEETKASIEEAGLKHNKEHKGMLKEQMAKAEFVKDVHMQCDWLLSSADTRKKAREDEQDSLQKATAILSGADLSLVQVGRSRMQASLSVDSSLSQVARARLRGYRQEHLLA